MIIRDLQLLAELGNTYRQQWKTIVWTNGCFDLLHPGHLKTFAEAKKLGDILVVWVNGDGSPYRASKPWRPINDEFCRTTLLDALSMIDVVFVYDEETPLLPIQALVPDVLLKGGDYIVEQIVGYDVVTKHGGQVVTIPIYQDYSTSSIIQKILSVYTADESK